MSKTEIKPSIVDTHAHLDMDAFNEDRSDVISRALDSGVNTIITAGTGLESSQKAISLAEEHPEVLATVGFHPHGAARVKQEDIARLAEMTRHPRVVAIGEMGLDFYRNLSPKETQIQVLKWQLELAVQLDLPVIIHCRQAERDLLPLLRDWTSSQKPGQPPGVIHCFMGDLNAARQYLDMGFFLSLGAYIGYPASRRAYATIKAIPDDRLTVETDSPFLPPQNLRGQRNEPAYVSLTIEMLAEIRGIPPDQIARETTQNAHRLFRLAQNTGQ